MIRICNLFKGTYTCVASTNPARVHTLSGELKVEGFKPSIDEPREKDHVVTEGEEIRILCKIDGDPKPLQRWLKVGKYK